jgi:hypothetical protein
MSGVNSVDSHMLVLDEHVLDHLVGRRHEGLPH